MQPIPNPSWAKRSRWLTQALLFSGTLNIALLVTFIYQGRQEIFSSDPKPLPAKQVMPFSNSEVLENYFQLSQEELLLRLENKDPLEEGLTRRDLALACLVSFHHFHLHKALGWLPLQRRVLRFTHAQEMQTIDVPIFAGLSDEQFQAILTFARTEKWPLTPRGLFFEIKRSWPSLDPTLLAAFLLTPEYQAVDTFLFKTGLVLTPEETITLIAEGEWRNLTSLKADFTPDSRREFLLKYITCRSRSAVKWLLAADLEFILKRFDDAQVLFLLDLYPDNDPLLENFAKRLIGSPRTDAVWKRAALALYMRAQEPIPQPYDHALVLQRFFPQEKPLAAQIIADTKPALPKIHVVEPGENLWKIARKYHVTIAELMQINHLETEKIRPGKKLEIPTPSKPA